MEVAWTKLAPWFKTGDSEEQGECWVSLNPGINFNARHAFEEPEIRELEVFTSEERRTTTKSEVQRG